MDGEKQIVETLEKILEVQNALLALQRELYENQRNAIATQHKALTYQHSTGRIYRISLVVAAVAVAAIVYFILHVWR